MESTVSKNTEFLSSTDKDIDEYLMRDSPVNFREGLYPTKEKDIVCDSEDLKQKLLGIEEKYIKKKKGEINDEGKIYVWDKHGIIIPEHYFTDPNKDPSNKNPNGEIEQNLIVGYDKFGNPLFSNKTLIGYDRRGLPIYADKIIVDYDKKGNPIFASTKKGKYANLIMPNSKTPHTTYQDTFTDPNHRLKAKIKK